MADLKDALQFLRPIGYDELPSDREKLLRDAFRHGETIINSIPPSPSASSSTPTTSHKTPNSARKANDTVMPPCSTAIDTRNEALQKAWGKPVKVNQKDNPLGITVYKCAGYDKFGAWFARRSVHQGLGYVKWKQAWQHEFLESLKAKGGPGAGAIRGITADRRVESHEIKGVGEMEVWQMSAVFGPVTPREFVELLMTSDNALSAASSLDGSGKPSRHLMVVSIPVTHKDSPPRHELVRATYESVEVIREIPVEGQDPELNPIEWIMVTRSDPGGGIPKFMVERGTPGSVVADTSKFLDWACPRDDFAEDDNGLVRRKTIDEHNPASHDEVSERHRESISQSAAGAQSIRDEVAASDEVAAPSSTESSGILSSTMNYVGQTAAAYLPSFGDSNEHTTAHIPDEEAGSETLSPVSSRESFMSADDGTSDSAESPSTSKTMNQSDVNLPGSRSRADTTTSTLSTATSSTANMASSTSSLAATLIAGEQEPSNNHEKEILKLHRKAMQLDEKAAKSRQTDQEKTAELDALAKRSDENGQSQQQGHQKALEHHVKETQKRQEKFSKEREKLEEKTRQEERKAQEKKRKEAEKSEINRMRKERDEARQGQKRAEMEVDELKRELDRSRKELVALKAQAARSESVSPSA